MIRIASGLLIVAAIAALFVMAIMVALLELVLPLLGRLHDWGARATSDPKGLQKVLARANRRAAQLGPRNS